MFSVCIARDVSIPLMQSEASTCLRFGMVAIRLANAVAASGIKDFVERMILSIVSTGGARARIGSMLSFYW